MLRTLREHRELNEEGFTLIELMVVVLIIAILLAIAIPTFLGARGNANNRAAQSALRNALTAEKTYFTNTNSVYVDSSTPGTLAAVEPAITWVAGPVNATSSNLATPNTVIAIIPTLATNGGVGATSAILLVAKSATGDCFYILDDTASPATKDSIGTSYLRDNKCSLNGAQPVLAVAAAANTATTLTWATNF